MASTAIPAAHAHSTADRKRIAFAPQTPFYRTLRRRVDEHLSACDVGAQGNAAAFIKVGVIMAWFASSYGLLLYGVSSAWAVLALGISTGFAVAGLGTCVQHDGGHGAFSKSKGVNHALALVLDWIGGSSYVWRFKHNVLHHTYPNIDGVDDDVSFTPLLRLAPSQTRHGYQRWQHLYIWPLYALLVFKWHWVDDFQNVLQARIGRHPFPRPRGLDLVTFILGKAALFCWAVAVPVALYGGRLGLLFYAATNMVAGLTLAIAFQLAHCVQRVHWLELPVTEGTRHTLHFGEHQLATTVDFARKNPLVTWYFGGLNFQVVHHLFPKICHIHYPAVSVILEQTCSEFGVPYHTQASFFGALRSHYLWLREMGQPTRVRV